MKSNETNLNVAKWRTDPFPPGGLEPLQAHSGSWSITDGAVQGQDGNYAYCHLTSTWTNYSIEAQVQVSSVDYGGGLGGRLNTSTGGHYAAWLYPGLNQIKLVKFTTWSDWGYNGTPFAPMAQTNVTVGAGWHSLKLVCSNALLQVYYHGTNVISVPDIEPQRHTAGAVSLDLFGAALSVNSITVRPLP